MTVSDYNNCVDQHSDGLYRFILKHIRDSDVAKDIVQDTFEKLWRKLNDIDAAKSKSYLFTAGYHTLIDYTRRQKKQGDFSEVDELSVSHNRSYSDVKEILNRALEKLPEIQKTVVLLRDYEGYDYTEIGEITNLSESQVKVYIFRARQFLKNYIGKMEVIL
jgi:RNA polymerase sigma factor (sigma-70 family)